MVVAMELTPEEVNEIRECLTKANASIKVQLKFVNGVIDGNDYILVKKMEMINELPRTNS